MKAFKYLILSLFSLSSHAYAETYALDNASSYPKIQSLKSTSKDSLCSQAYNVWMANYKNPYENYAGYTVNTYCNFMQAGGGVSINFPFKTTTPDPEPEPQCQAGIVPVTLKVPVTSGKMVCVQNCQYSLSKCVDVDFEAGMTCDGVNEGRECGTPPPTTTPTTPPVTQDPTNPTDKTDEQKTFENIMHVIGEKLDGIKDAITGGNQNQNGGDTGGSNGGTTGDVTVNVDMSETNAKIDETNSLIDELTKWLEGEDLGDDIFGDSEPPEKELTPQQLDTNIFSGRSQCPADARLSFNLLGGKTFTKTFEFKDWCDNLEIFGSFILIASYLYGAYIIVSKS